MLKVKRNFYGRQNQSFEGDVQFLNNRDIYCFIRAPKITKLLNDNVETVATHNSEIVGVSQMYTSGAACKNGISAVKSTSDQCLIFEE